MDLIKIQKERKITFTALVVLIGLVVHILVEKYNIEPSQDAESFAQIIYVILSFFGETGHFLAAVVSVHLVYDLFLKEQEDEIISEKIHEQLSRLKNETIPIMMDYGLEEIHRFKLEELLKGLKKGDELHWLDTYCPQINGILNRLEEALELEVKVKILTMKKDSNVAKYRSQELEGEVQDEFVLFNQQVNLYHDGLSKILSKQESRSKDNLEVRFYDDLPGVPMYIVVRDGVLFVGYTGWYLNKSASKNIFLKWGPAKKAVLESVESYFDKKWDNNEQYAMDGGYQSESLQNNEPVQ